MIETEQNEPTLEEKKPILIEKLQFQEKEGDDILRKKEAQELLKNVEDLKLELEIRITSICNENINEIELLHINKGRILREEKNELQHILGRLISYKNNLECFLNNTYMYNLQSVRLIKISIEKYKKQINQLYWQSHLEENNINDLKEILTIRDNVVNKINKDGVDLGLCLLNNTISSTLQISKGNMKKIRKYNKKYMSYFINSDKQIIQQPNKEEIEKILKRIDKNEKDLAEMKKLLKHVDKNEKDLAEMEKTIKTC